MKLKIIFPSLLILCLDPLSSIEVNAQTFSTLHNFTALASGTNADGAAPNSKLILSGIALYGTTYNGGHSGCGTVFTVGTNGTGFATVHDFPAANSNGDMFNSVTNNGGISPQGLIGFGNTLYGSAFGGGSLGYGTIFSVNTDGAGFQTLHDFPVATGFSNFTNSEGENPVDTLVLFGNALFGVTGEGGTLGQGTVFTIVTNGMNFKVLYDFTTGDEGVEHASLALSGDSLFGTTYYGGDAVWGSVFILNTNGTGYTNLHSFTTLPPYYTNEDGGNPGKLILSGNILYGVTSSGGESGSGTLFAVNTDGTGFTNLHTFTANAGYPTYTNLDGSYPYGLIQSGNTLYGTTYLGGISGNGTVFALHTDGSGFTTLHNFTALSGTLSTNSDGANSQGDLVLSGNVLYGTTFQGGSFGSGTVFSIALPAPPSLTIQPGQSKVILTWPTNTAGLTFSLQSTTNLASSPGWSDVFPVAVITSGKNTVTNAVSGTQRFYRLSQ
ncbi:MAG TPA: choice-of-anchor tandem repeat GloVer-containing protein [Verrucomicrobiae bacterium]|jgi:uncharacterized repeat protein (TIGR03803 family)|nr:choice-of-anchor tandem repeat GloVer-containing protein [Verrucomicrobiae bacterium]